MVLMEFALIYGNDFFVIPVDLAAGSACLIRSLVVTDSFGERTLIEPTGQAGHGGCSARATGPQGSPPSGSC